MLFRISHGLGRPEDLDLMLSFGDNIVPGLNAPFAQTTICAMGPSTMCRVVSLDRFFREEILERLEADADASHRAEGRERMSGPRPPFPMSQWPSDHRYVLPGAPGEDASPSPSTARGAGADAASCSSRSRRTTAPTSRASATTSA